MPLYAYTLAQAEQWDKTVKSFSLYDVYHLSGYVKAFEIHGDGEPMLFYYESDAIRAINVVMKRDIGADARFEGKLAKGEWFDFATPYGYGGWLIEGSGDTTPVFEAYKTWCAEHNIVSEFVRFHPVLDNCGQSEQFYEVILLGSTVAMDLSSSETIWNNLTSKNRNVIRKAMNAGVRICHGSSAEIYKVFREIYNQTMKADEAAPYYYFGEAFYESVRTDLSEESTVFWAELDGKIIAASIMLASNGFMNYHLSGSIWDYRQFAPTNLLLYEAALWGCENGFKTLHLGGGLGSKEDNLYKFKSAFNRNEKNRFAIGKKIFNEKIYAELVKMRQIDTDSTFFPAYRS